jgi:Methyltransferase domain
MRLHRRDCNSSDIVSGEQQQQKLLESIPVHHTNNDSDNNRSTTTTTAKNGRAKRFTIRWYYRTLCRFLIRVSLIAVLVLCTIALSRLVDWLATTSTTSTSTSTTLSSIRTVSSTTTPTSALATLACFVTPTCFPSTTCHSGIPQKLQRSKHWEEQSFCVEDLRPTIATEQLNGRSSGSSTICLVYSFGIHTSWEWEEKVATLFGCEVHAFDPTMDHPHTLAPGVTFHKFGLQADGVDVSTTHGAEYEPIDPNVLLSLPDIMHRLGHEQRVLDVLMLDCEGCEWGALHNLICSKQSTAIVKQIVTEFHFQRNLGLQNETDIYIAAEAIQCLWEDRWHIVSMEAPVLPIGNTLRAFPPSYTIRACYCTSLCDVYRNRSRHHRIFCSIMRTR